MRSFWKNFRDSQWDTVFLLIFFASLIVWGIWAWLS